MSTSSGISCTYVNGNGNNSVTQKRKISESGDLSSELIQENSDLRRQYQKLVEDLREKISQVDYAEDKIIKLERSIESLKKQHRSVIQPMEKKIDEYRRTVVQQADAVEDTKELLRNKASRLSRAEKELNDLKEERDASQSELEKACDEVQWYQNYNTALKAELKRNQDMCDRHRSEDSLKMAQLEFENTRISTALEELAVSYKRLESERTELEEAIAKHRSPSTNHTESVFQNNIYDSDDELVMDSAALLGTAFPLVKPGKSLLCEIQSSWRPLITANPVKEAWTQTQDPIPLVSCTLQESPKAILEPVSESEATPPQKCSTENRHSEFGHGDRDRINPSEENVTVSPKKPEKWKMLQPIDHRRNTVSMGVIPDADHEHMIQYAFDVPLRSCHKEAAILSRREWRTLHGDLDTVDLETFKKSFGQEEDTDDVGLYRAARKADDLDEIAETYSEQFPFLVESLFEHLQEISPIVAPLEDLPFLKARFQELAQTFRTDHDQFERRERIVKNEHDDATNRLANLSTSLKEVIKVIRSQKIPGELRELFNHLQDEMSSLDRLTSSLNGSAKRLGRLEVLGRVFRLIEVMVLYVRVLKNVSEQMVEERDLAKKLLLANGISCSEFPSDTKPLQFHTYDSSKENNNLVTGANYQKGVNSSMDADSKTTRIAKGKNFLRKLLQRRPQSQKTILDSNADEEEKVAHMIKSPRRLGLFGIRDWVIQEFNWPWDGNKTWNGIRKGFAMILMLLAILLIFKITSIPSCGTSFSVRSLFGINYKYPPRI